MSLHGYLGIFLDTRTDIWWLARSFFAVLGPASMMLFGFLGRHRAQFLHCFCSLKGNLDRDSFDLAPVRDEHVTDFFGRDPLPDHFPVGFRRVVLFDPQDEGHEVVQS